MHAAGESFPFEENSNCSYPICKSEVSYIHIYYTEILPAHKPTKTPTQRYYFNQRKYFYEKKKKKKQFWSLFLRKYRKYTLINDRK